MEIQAKKATNSQKLGLISLVSIVVSTMIGSGIDGLPQNMAVSSALGPIVIAWIICGVGMYCIARTFMLLSNMRPDLNAGIYMYAREGFGPFIAFNVAWGYWLMNIFSNVAFAIIIMDTLNYFLPGDFKGGNNIASIIGASLLIWSVNFMVLAGTRSTGRINTFGTFAKMIPLFTFIIIVFYALNYAEFTDNIWGQTQTAIQPKLGSVSSQVMSPLSVALWCFIGIEGAVALSGRAKNKKDVGKATFIGFVISLSLCIFVSILPFGVLSQAELKTIPTPSTAGVLKIITGDWGEWLINFGVLVSVITSWLAWTMICAEIPMAAAQNSTFPKIFAHKNKKGAASVSLWVSALLMQLVVLCVYFSSHAWLMMLNIASITVVPAYIASNAYLLKLCITGEYMQYAKRGRYVALVTSIIGVFFCLLMFYATQIQYVVFVPVTLMVGFPLYILAKKQHQPNTAILAKNEIIYFILLLLLAVAGLTGMYLYL